MLFEAARQKTGIPVLNDTICLQHEKLLQARAWQLEVK